jgi:hypothetical protein
MSSTATDLVRETEKVKQMLKDEMSERKSRNLSNIRLHKTSMLLTRILLVLLFSGNDNKGIVERLVLLLQDIDLQTHIVCIRSARSNNTEEQELNRKNTREKRNMIRQYFVELINFMTEKF